MINIEKLKKNKGVKEFLEFGIINIDKPSGPTSFDVSDFVKKKLGLRKTSHFGTLDPKVTGVLPIALNRACKLTGYFLGEDKEYVGVMRIHKDVSLKEIKKAIKEKFIGKIIQLPPVKSRVKRQYRQREIKKFKILEKDGKNIKFHAEVQGGTYIRKLIHDLGQALGVGAHMTKLRRIRAGIFMEKDLVKLEDVKEANLKKIIIPAEIVSQVYPVIQIKKDSVDRILHGQPIYNKNLIKKYDLKKEQVVSVFYEDEFVGMFKIIKSKDIFAKPEFVKN